ncbi:ABC transporter substrate-binding protein [Nocardia aurantia]|uniref:Glutathione-binding protein GsiB n=1 Tax=Nocardia aurantia TaxID=2585199 RepID=A0A7K0DRM7_9NOCA|nr:ABC transporter substrate-binding protein [Nocardia aurantia]MQY28430.1 Glutathione-binding protein GsiB [Nocardia aurantia]
MSTHEGADGSSGRPGIRARRRRAAWIAAGAVAAVVVVAGVVAGVAGSGSHAADAEAKDGTLVYGISGTQVSLDPAVAATAVTSVINRNIFDSLVAQTGPDTFGPWLASSWTVSGDGLTYRFALREGVTFHDGTPFTADAVRASLDHVVEPKTKSAYAASLISAYQQTRIIDPHTVEIVLKQPFAPFLQALSTPSLGIQSPAALGAANYRPVGTGPFAFDQWDQGRSETLTRFDGYDSPPPGAAHSGPARLRTLVFRFINEDATRYGALTSGQVQAIAGVPPVSAGDLAGRADFTLRSDETPGLNYNVYLNQSRGPLADPEVRRALTAAVDVAKLVNNIYFGRYPVADNPISKVTADYDASARADLTGYDPENAKRLLDRAGWNRTDSDGIRLKDGVRLSLVWPYWPDGTREQRDVVADGIRAQARAVGIDIQRPTVDTGTYIDKYLIGGGYDLVDVSFARPTPDVLRFAFFSANTYAKAGGNVALVTSPQLDAQVTDAAATTDPHRAAANYAAVQHEVLKQAYIIPIYTPVSLTGVAKSVHDLSFDVQTYPRFYDAWLSK